MLKTFTYIIILSRAVEVLFFSALINALLMLPGPLRKRVGGKLPQVP